MAFAAMLLASVLFLTGVWHEPILTAGLDDLPRPGDGRAERGPGARLGSRFGPGRVGAVGALLFALGGVWWVTHLTGAPHYAADFLPGMMIGGVGVGLMIPSLTGAVASTLAPARLATGIAVQTTGRQIGSALGFAILVAVLAAAAHRGRLRGRVELHDRREPAAGATLVAIGGRASVGVTRTSTVARTSTAVSGSAMLALASKLELSEMDLP